MKFISPQYPEQKVVLRSASHMIDSMGNRIFKAGKAIKFIDGIYDTNDPEEISYIKSLDVYGTEIFSAEEPSVASDTAIHRQNTERNAVPQATACPKCSFKAKSEFGLKSHVRARHSADEDEEFDPTTPRADDIDILPRG